MLVLFRDLATHDVELALGWYESQRRGLGREFRAAVDIVVERIEANPEAFPVVRRTGVRRALLRRFPYALYYRIASERAVVEACMHTRQHPNAWRSRR